MRTTKQVPNGARPFVLIDKPVLLSGPPFTVDPARLRFATGWTHALARLYHAGFGLAFVSNESGIAFGYYDEHSLEVVHRHVEARFASRGIELAGFLYCPHHPVGTVTRYVRDCDCHLPKPGLLRRAAAERDADLRRSWVISSSTDNIVAARHVSCRAMLVDSGHEPELLVVRRQAQPHGVAPDLITAADVIIEEMHAEAAA